MECISMHNENDQKEVPVEKCDAGNINSKLEVI